MKLLQLGEINIRDPFVLLHEGKYYLYGTRSATCWGPADGFDCYVSEDLAQWQGPFEIFHRPENFFADRNFWAPECVYHQGSFYLITTFGAEGMNKGIYVLKSEKPTGPFQLYGQRLTPENWTCIDGTLYFEDGVPILIFSHSFCYGNPVGGDISMVALKEDLSGPAGESIKLFTPEEAPWPGPFPYAKEEFGLDGVYYLTDGPCVAKLENGKLYMTWSSFTDKGYAVGVAVSDSGRMAGPWRQLPAPLYPENGGHGMMFRTLEGDLKFTLHYPNDKYLERPQIVGLALENGILKLGN